MLHRSLTIGVPLTVGVLLILGSIFSVTALADSAAVPVAESAASTEAKPPAKPTVKLPSNLIRLPLTRQATDYTCGVAAIQSVLAYYGEEFSEIPLSKKLKSNERIGTAYMQIANFSKKQGFNVNIHKNMTIGDLKALIDKKLPVVCLLQAWSEKQIDYRNEWNDGHYVVAVGYDEKNIFFMDPSTLGNFAYIPESEFIDRWHDTDGKERLTHFGMVVSREKVSYQPDVATFME